MPYKRSFRCICNGKQQRQAASSVDSLRVERQESQVASSKSLVARRRAQESSAGNGTQSQESLACSMSAANIVTNYMRHKAKETAWREERERGNKLSNQVVYVIEEKVSENCQTTAAATASAAVAGAVIGRKRQHQWQWQLQYLQYTNLTIQ